jgi:hypothetical protein
MAIGASLERDCAAARADAGMNTIDAIEGVAQCIRDGERMIWEPRFRDALEVAALAMEQIAAPDPHTPGWRRARATEALTRIAAILEGKE